MTDEYKWWRDALAGAAPEAILNEPQCGFYAIGKGANRQPAAIFLDEGHLSAVKDFAEVPVDPHDIWSKCYNHPISDQKYWQAVEETKWADTDGLVDQPADAGPATGGEVEIPTVGHNQPPEEIDPRDEIEEKIKAAIGIVNETIPKDGIRDEETANKVANGRDRLRELWQKADATRKAEKKPHDEAAKAVQARWSPVLELAKAGGETAAAAATGYLTWRRKEDARIAAEAEAERQKLEAERAAKEAARLAAEEAAKEKGEPPPPPEPEPEPIPEPAPPPAKARIGGALSGRRSSLRVKRRWAVIDDYDALLAVIKNHTEIKAAAQSVADAAARSQTPLAGCHFEKEESA